MPCRRKRCTSLPKGVSKRTPSSAARMRSFSSLEEKLARHEVLSLLRRRALGEVHEVDGGAPRGDELLDRLVQRPLAVQVLERHRSERAAHLGHLAPGEIADAAGDGGHVAERGRHEEIGRVLEEEQRHLPGEPALAISVVVELVHHDRVRPRAVLAERHAGQDLGRAAEDGRVAVDAGVAGHHADVLRPEDLAQREELLVDERLDRAGVDGAPTLRHGLEVEEGRDERLTRPGRRGEDHVPPVEERQDGLFLRGIQLEARRAHPGDEAVEDGVGSEALAARRQLRRERGERGERGGHHRA